jgi:hypothetical protein
LDMTFSKLKLVFGLTMAMTSAVVSAQTVKLALTGMQEVPAVTTAASGSGTITIAPDMSVSGSVTTMGVEGTMAHIHVAAAGQNGPVVVPMMKTGDNVWSIAAGAKLTEAQYQAFKDGNLYVNVHSATNKGGEIRAQLKP